MHIIQSFLEGFHNGFYAMQTPIETIFAWLGNLVFSIIGFFGGK